MTRKRANLERSIVQRVVAGFKPASRIAELYHCVLSCSLNNEDRISKPFFFFFPKCQGVVKKVVTYFSVKFKKQLTFRLICIKSNQLKLCSGLN
jgi:hypothetical protein